MLATRLFFWWNTVPLTWPETLPTRPEWPSYKETPAVQTVRSNIESGRPSMRRRSVAVAQPFTCHWLMTAAQQAAFETFYVSTLGEGAAAFDGLVHPRTGVAGIWRFTGPPQYDWLGPDCWRVTTPIELLP